MITINNKDAIDKIPTLDNGKLGRAKTHNCDSLWCIFCKKARHTREKCWTLHRKSLIQEWGQKKEQQRSNGYPTIWYETIVIRWIKQIKKLREWDPCLAIWTSLLVRAYWYIQVSSHFSLNLVSRVHPWPTLGSWTKELSIIGPTHPIISPSIPHVPSNKKIIAANGSLATIARKRIQRNSSSFMFLNCPETLYQFKNSLKIYVAMLFFAVVIVYFKTKIQWRWLDMLKNDMGFTTLNTKSIKPSQGKFPFLLNSNSF